MQQKYLMGGNCDKYVKINMNLGKVLPKINI